MTDRTLDQQCTVTRPGVAPIASALLVEIFVGLLQGVKGSSSPTPKNSKVDREIRPLGVVPHQVRGFLSDFENKVIWGKRYDSCSACSPSIMRAYISDGWKFVRRALNEKGYVEELSGLAEVRPSTSQVTPHVNNTG